MITYVFVMFSLITSVLLLPLSSLTVSVPINFFEERGDPHQNRSNETMEKTESTHPVTSFDVPSFNETSMTLLNSTVVVTELGDWNFIRSKDERLFVSNHGKDNRIEGPPYLNDDVMKNSPKSLSPLLSSNSTTEAQGSYKSMPSTNTPFTHPYEEKWDSGEKKISQSTNNTQPEPFIGFFFGNPRPRPTLLKNDGPFTTDYNESINGDPVIENVGTTKNSASSFTEMHPFTSSTEGLSEIYEGMSFANTTTTHPTELKWDSDEVDASDVTPPQHFPGFFFKNRLASRRNITLLRSSSPSSSSSPSLASSSTSHSSSTSPSSHSSPPSSSTSSSSTSHSSSTSPTSHSSPPSSSTSSSSTSHSSPSSTPSSSTSSSSSSSISSTSSSSSISSSTSSPTEFTGTSGMPMPINNESNESLVKAETIYPFSFFTETSLNNTNVDVLNSTFVVGDQGFTSLLSIHDEDTEEDDEEVLLNTDDGNIKSSASSLLKMVTSTSSTAAPPVSDTIHEIIITDTTTTTTYARVEEWDSDEKPISSITEATPSEPFPGFFFGTYRQSSQTAAESTNSFLNDASHDEDDLFTKTWKDMTEYVETMKWDYINFNPHLQSLWQIRSPWIVLVLFILVHMIVTFLFASIVVLLVKSVVGGFGTIKMTMNFAKIADFVETSL